MTVNRTLIAILAAIVLIGCGGTSGTNNAFSGGLGGNFAPQQGLANRGPATGSIAGTTDTISVFLTDSNKPVNAIWLKLHKVTLDTSKESYTVFQSDEGEWIDIRSLHDKAGCRFRFIGSAGPIVGDPVRAKVEVGDIAKIGSQSGKLDAFPIAGSESGKTQFVTNLNPRGTKAGPYGLVLDFESKRIGLNGEQKVNVSVREAEANGLADAARQVNDEWIGKIASISGSAPILAVSVDLGGNRFARLNTNTATQILGTGETAPSLAQGMKVRFTGTYNVTTKAVDCQVLTVVGEKVETESILAASVVDKPSEDGAVLFDYRTGRKFEPSISRGKIIWNQGTTFNGASGARLTQSEFLSALAQGELVVAEGAWNEKESGFEAMRISLLTNGASNAKLNLPAAETTATTIGGGNDALSGVVVLTGKATEFKANDGTFVLAIESQEGWKSAEKSATVVVDSQTKFFASDASPLERNQFFSEAKTKSMSLEVKGTVGRDGRVSALLVSVK